LVFLVGAKYGLSSIAICVGVGVGFGLVELTGRLRRTRIATFEYTTSTSLAPDNATAPCTKKKSPATTVSGTRMLRAYAPLLGWALVVVPRMFCPSMTNGASTMALARKRIETQSVESG